MTASEVPDENSEWWTSTDVAAYLGVQVGTISSYRNRGQMPDPDSSVGRSPVWRPARIIAWHGERPRPGVGGRPEAHAGGGVEVLHVATAMPDQAGAERLAAIAVELKVAASAQITGPVISTFWHQGEFGTGKEYRLVLVTHAERYEELEKILRENHPWSNPEIVATAISAGSSDYLEWVREAVMSETSGEH